MDPLLPKRRDYTAAFHHILPIQRPELLPWCIATTPNRKIFIAILQLTGVKKSFITVTSARRCGKNRQGEVYVSPNFLIEGARSAFQTWPRYTRRAEHWGSNRRKNIYKAWTVPDAYDVVVFDLKEQVYIALLTFLLVKLVPIKLTIQYIVYCSKLWHGAVSSSSQKFNFWNTPFEIRKKIVVFAGLAH